MCPASFYVLPYVLRTPFPFCIHLPFTPLLYFVQYVSFCVVCFFYTVGFFPESRLDFAWTLLFKWFGFRRRLCALFYTVACILFLSFTLYSNGLPSGRFGSYSSIRIFLPLRNGPFLARRRVFGVLGMCIRWGGRTRGYGDFGFALRFTAGRWAGGVFGVNPYFYAYRLVGFGDDGVICIRGRAGAYGCARVRVCACVRVYVYVGGGGGGADPTPTILPPLVVFCFVFCRVLL